MARTAEEHAVWLAQVAEPALEPERPICDPHHHFWRDSFLSNAAYLLDDLLDDAKDHNVVSTVFIECLAEYRTEGVEALRPVGETEFVEAIASQCAAAGHRTQAAKGIVGFADLLLGDGVGAVLDAHMAVSKRFRGIRHAGGWDASNNVRNSHTKPFEHLFLDTTFRRGLAQLAPRRLTFEAWLYHTQIAELTDLARAFPDTTIILNHYGGPLGIGPYEGRAQEVFEVWKPAIAELAGCPNVVAKLGGLAMTLNGFGWHKRERPPGSEELADQQRPYVMHMIDCFGPQRCMFESNFPVDKVSVGYTVLWNAFKRLAAIFSEDEKAALFHDTATRVYRL